MKPPKRERKTKEKRCGVAFGSANGVTPLAHGGSPLDPFFPFVLFFFSFFFLLGTIHLISDSNKATHKKKEIRWQQPQAPKSGPSVLIFNRSLLISFPLDKNSWPGQLISFFRIRSGSNFLFFFSFFLFGCRGPTKKKMRKEKKGKNLATSSIFTGLYWVLLGFTGFYWVLLGSTGFY